MLVGGGDAKTTKQYFTQLPASVIPRRMEDTDSYTQGHSQPTVCVQSLSHDRLLVTPWTVACQAPLSMGFSRQEYWSGLPFLSPRDLPHSAMESKSPASPALQAEFFLPLIHRGSHLGYLSHEIDITFPLTFTETALVSLCGLDGSSNTDSSSGRKW